MTEDTSRNKSLNFIEQFVEEDIASGRYHGAVHTRFPPEPNGFLHIGHAKAICLNFGIAKKYNGLTNLRFDDTNPTTEDTEYVNAIRADIKWLGFDWGEREYYASDYFQQLYDFAEDLIKKGLAYVDDSSSEDIASMKGTPTEDGVNSPYRDRSVDENLSLFREMRDGKFVDGEKVLRARIDMASPNMLMRDPVLYRIKHEHHHRTGDDWCIYPLYDFAHGQSDSIENITHSLCSLEFKNHRPLYNWFIEKLEIYPSRQIEFSRLNLNYTIMSKRKLLKLVESGSVNGWDDPRMPTLSGMRRRGYTAEAIRNFINKVGLTKRENIIDVGLLEFCVREDLNKIAPRVMAVLDPIKVVISNYPEAKEEWLTAENNPEDPSQGSRQLPFSRELFIERDDFMINPPRKYFRLGPERYVRLKHAYIIQCESYEMDETGNIQTVYCKYFENSKSGSDQSGIKAKGTLHWVSAAHACDAEIRLYDRLFSDENPDGHKDRDFMEFLNPDSLVTIPDAKIEPALLKVSQGDKFQFMRKGYFCADKDFSASNPIFNRTVSLRDSWAKIRK